MDSIRTLIKETKLFKAEQDFIEDALIKAMRKYK